MEKNINFSQSGVNTLELFLTNSETEPFFTKAYSELQQKVAIAGFRKGKVPVAMLKKLYGKSIEAEVNVDIVNDYFPKIAEDNNLSLISNPILKDVQYQDDGMKYIIEFQTVPEFQINNYQDLSIYEPIHITTSEEIEQELDQIALEYAEYEDADSIDSLDYVVNVGVEPIKEGEEDEHHHDEHHHHNHDHQSIYLRDKQFFADFRNAFLNKKVGDVFNFKSAEKPDEPELKIYIESVQRVTPPALDDELAKKYSNQKLDTIEDLRKDIEFRIQDYWDNKSRQEIENQLMDTITKQNSHIVVPEPLIENALDILVENLKKQYNIKKEDTKLDATLRTTYRKTAENYARWDMIRNEIIKKEAIEIEDYDIDDFIEKNKESLPDVSVEQLHELIQGNNQIKENLKNKKLFDLLIGFSTTNDISFEDYYKQREIENAEKSDSPKIKTEEYNPLNSDEDTDEIEGNSEFSDESPDKEDE